MNLSANLSHVTSYLSGDRLVCKVTLENVTSEEQVVGWAGAQIHCQCTSKEDLVRPPAPSSAGLMKTQTSFLPNRGEKGCTLFSTSPSVLCCDLQLKPKEKQLFIYSETIPLKCLPSFAGHLIRFTWKLTVGASRPNAEACILRIPFRVMTVPDKILTYVKSAQSPKLSNPFLNSKKSDSSKHDDILLQALAHETSKRNLVAYDLKNAKGILGRLHVFKSVYRLGEEIICRVDFEGATVPCLQMRILLQSIEEIAPEHFIGGDKSIGRVIVTHAQDTQSCSFAKQKHFTVPIPSHLTHSFQTDMVTISWQLYLEFVTTDSFSNLGCLKRSQNGAFEEWTTKDMSTSHTSLDLPITILATNPSQTESRPSMLHEVNF